MKPVTWLLSLGLLLTMGLLLASPPAPDEAHLSLVLGKVYLQKAGESEWSRAKMNTSLNLNDQIRTEKRSRCEIKLSDKKIIRVGEKSDFQIKDLADNPELDLKQGRIWLNVVLEDENLNLRTPTSVAAIRGTIYRADASSKSSHFRVYEGSVGVSGLDENGQLIPDSLFVIEPGNEFIITDDLDSYLEEEKQQQEQFMEDDRSLFQKFLQQEQEKRSQFEQRDKEGFSTFQAFDVKMQGFDAEEDLKDDWVKWNKDLDQSISR